MTSILLFLLSMLILGEPEKCDCDPIDINKYEDVKGHDFIALIKVKEIFKIDSTQNASKWNYGLKVEIEQLFKGQTSGVIYINGGHSDITEWSTSCDWEINPGSNFIIFGNVHEEIPYSGLCSPVMQNSKADIHKLEQLLKN